MRCYYKDNKGNLFNFKSEHFVKYKEVTETITLMDEEGTPFLDENGDPITQTITKTVRDGLEDGYTQITEEEFNELSKPKVYKPTAEQKAAQEKAKKVAGYKAYLSDTDYIVLKIAEAQSEGETSTVAQLRDIYKEQLKERKRVRSLLN